MFRVGVTGTNGKSTTTTWAAGILAQKASPVALVTTLGMACVNEAAEVSYLDEFPPTHAGFMSLVRHSESLGGSYICVETTSESLMRGFAQGFPCDVGVFTNLTRDHFDAHGTAEHYLACKAQLFVTLRTGGAAVFNAMDKSSALLDEVTPTSLRRIHYGIGVDCDLRADSVHVDRAGTTANLSAFGQRYPMQLRTHGAHFVENALAALGAALHLGLPLERGLTWLAQAPAPSGRFEVVHNSPLVVVDYAHTPDALVRTLNAARTLVLPGGKLIVVFGAGGGRDQGKRVSMGQAATSADRVVLTSDNPRNEDPAAIANEIRVGLANHPEVVLEADRLTAIETELTRLQPSDVLVIAGKGHEQTQQIGDDKRVFCDQAVVRHWVAIHT